MSKIKINEPPRQDYTYQQYQHKVGIIAIDCSILSTGN